MGTPDYNSYVNEAFGWPDEGDDGFDYDDYAYFQTANNLVVGTNPPYSVTDFLAFYPNFGGIPTLYSGTTDGITANVTGLPNLTGLAVGQAVAGPNITNGSVIASIAANQTSNFTVVLSLPTKSATTAMITFYTSPALPLAVINVYIVLASASLFQARWGELWTFAMALYVAHLCTLWLIGQSVPVGSTAAAVATSGLAIGIKTSKSVQDVSIGSTPLAALDSFGAFQLTLYGQQLATYAQTIGAGNMLIW